MAAAIALGRHEHERHRRAGAPGPGARGRRRPARRSGGRWAWPAAPRMLDRAAQARARAAGSRAGRCSSGTPGRVPVAGHCREDAGRVAGHRHGRDPGHRQVRQGRSRSCLEEFSANFWISGVGAGWDAELDGLSGSGAGDLIDLGELVVGAGQADLESFDLAEPAFALGFGDAGGAGWRGSRRGGVSGRVGAQERASQAPLTELTPMFQQFMACFRSLALTCPRDRIG